MTESALRVLVIDDEPAIRKLLKISMQAYGYELGEAAAGQEGLLMAASLLFWLTWGCPIWTARQS